jgi:hypothetical protein
MANGVALERLLEPELVPNHLYGTMLASLFTGLKALHEAQQEAPAP